MSKQQENKTTVHFFLTGDFPNGNGVNSRIKIIANCLTENNIDVQLNYLWPSQFNNNYINKTKQGEYNGYRFKYFSLFLKQPKNLVIKFFNTLYTLLHTVAYIFKHINKIDVFYLYCPTIIYNFQIILLAKLAGKKVIIERTELFSKSYKHTQSKWWQAKYYPTKLLELSFKLDETFTGYFCDDLIVISQPLYEFYLPQMGEANIHLLPILVDTNIYKPENKNKPLNNTIGYLGSFGYKDGVPQLMDAVKVAKATIPELKLKLIGFSDNISAWEHLIDEKGLTGDVEITGLCTIDEVIKHLHDCDLLVCNRIDIPYAHYGSPTKVAEYIATGIPTVVTDVGDITNYLNDDNASIIKPNNTTQLSNTIINRYKNPETYVNKANKGLDVVKNHFTIVNYSKKLIGLIHNDQQKTHSN